MSKKETKVISKKVNGTTSYIGKRIGKTVVIDTIKKPIQIPLLHWLNVFHQKMYNSGIITETQKNQIQNQLLADSLENELNKGSVVFEN